MAAEKRKSDWLEKQTKKPEKKVEILKEEKAHLGKQVVVFGKAVVSEKIYNWQHAELQAARKLRKRDTVKNRNAETTAQYKGELDNLKKMIKIRTDGVT